MSSKASYSSQSRSAGVSFGEILNEKFLKPLRLSLLRPASRKTERDREHVTLNSTEHEHEYGFPNLIAAILKD